MAKNNEVVVESGLSFEDNVEIPKAQRSGAWDGLKDMKVGQMLFFSGDDAKIKARQAYQSATKTHGIKLAQRQFERNGVKGIGLWRTA